MITRRPLRTLLAAGLVVAALTAATIPAHAATAPKPGSVCKIAARTTTVNGLTFTCTKKGKTLVWSKGALAKLATASTIRIGFFANVTHASALVGIDKGIFEKYFGKDGTKIEYTVFNAGPAEIEAIKGGAIDIGYIGPNPAISGFVSTDGELIRVISGATSGGAQLVVKSDINTIADLKGKTIATPQLGNTQDVALRAFLKKNGFNVSLAGGGDVNIVPTDNATALTLFQQGKLDGAWVPEPWASRLVIDAKAKVLVDEATLWPNGDFITTNIIASSDFLKKYPGSARSLLLANIEATQWAKANSAAAQDSVQAQLLKWTTKKLSDDVIKRAWSSLKLSWDPLAATLKTSANNAVKAGVLTNLGADGLSGIYDLRLLNQVLKFQGLPTVSSNKLGLE